MIKLKTKGTISIENKVVFTDSESPYCLAFIASVFSVQAIKSLTLRPGDVAAIDLHFDASNVSSKALLSELAESLVGTRINESARAAGTALGLYIAPTVTARDRHGIVHYHRYESRVTGFQVIVERTGYIKLKNPVLYRKQALCYAIERELTNVLGVLCFKSHSTQCYVSIEYDPRRLSRIQIIELLDRVLTLAEHQSELDQLDLDLGICTGSIGLAAAALFAYTSIPSLTNAYRALRDQKKVGVDFLDSIVVLGCLMTLQVFPGAILSWCLSFGRMLVRKTEDRSKSMLLSAFGKQPRFVWLLKDGVEVEVPLDSLLEQDVVVVHTGDMVPVDGHIIFGMAMIDQQGLTGESTPVEKGMGNKVFASTILVAGKIHVSVEKAGSETASAKISQILNDTAGYKLTSQNTGEKLADTAVFPTLIAGALAYGTLGPHAGVAALNSDLGTGIRMAAPLAMLSTLTLCAQKGILVKDGRALELMNEIDTVLFDKTGTLTRERPEVGRVLVTPSHTESDVIRYAAAAEQKFHHPIAEAVLHKAQELGIDLPPTDETQYKVGFGIQVQIEGKMIRVGSQRYMAMEGLHLTPEISVTLAAAHKEGFTLVMVAIDDQLAGALELRSSIRPEVGDLIKGLRKQGIKHIAIISGDHDAPTKKLAEQLGMDRYFAEVLPADKAAYVEELQKEGRKVCFIGDGINDSIALKKANVSISLNGAASIATDTAHIVFMENGLSKLCEFKDIAGAMSRNVRNSWIMIVVPNVVCVAGVFLFGFGIGTSVVTNNVSALVALANGLWPMRRVAQIEMERRKKMELELRQEEKLSLQHL
jgi:Cu2+-exporting ATPase